MNNLYNYFEKLYNEDKLSHAFLIGNVSLEYIKDELNRIFSDFIFKSQMNVENNPNIYYLEEKNGIIKKESIKELLKNLTITSQFDGKKVYVIENCENLNDASYNAILKTLEEPPEGVYAFLLTSNIDAVKPTIVSRCQKIFISSCLNEIIDDSYVDIGKELIENIEKNGINTISINSNLYKSIVDRNMLSNILKYMLKIYMDELNSLAIDNKNNNYLLKNNTVDSLIKKLLIINENINRLNGNLNKNISLDRIIIEMGRCNI